MARGEPHPSMLYAASRLVNAELQQTNKFLIEIRSTAKGSAEEGLVSMYAQSVSYTPSEISYEAKNVGNIVFQLPEVAGSVEINAEFLDDDVHTAKNYFESWAAEWVLGDGTYNLPFLHARRFSVFPLNADGYKKKNRAGTVIVDSFNVVTQNIGEVSYSTETPDLQRLPVTFMQLRSNGDVTNHAF